MSACELVRNELGVSILSELGASKYLGKGLKLRLFVPKIPYRLTLLRPVFKRPSLVALAFMQLFEESLEQNSMYWRCDSPCGYAGTCPVSSDGNRRFPWCVNSCNHNGLGNHKIVRSQLNSLHIDRNSVSLIFCSRAYNSGVFALHTF